MQKLLSTSVQITGLSHEGRGIGDYQEKKVFVEGALPNEVVKVLKIREKSNFIEGLAIDIDLPSEHRTEPNCEFFQVCGGCSLQHMNQSLQMEFKSNALKEQLQHFGGLNAPEFMGPIFDSKYGYRRKARLGVKYVVKKDKVLVGFREKNGKYLADINNCSVLHPQIAQLIMPLQIMIYKLDIKDQIPQIEVAMGDDDIALIFRILSPIDTNSKTALIEFAKEHDLNLYVEPNKPEIIYNLFNKNNDSNYLDYAIKVLNLNYKFHPTDFTQVNSEINRKLVPLAIELLELKNDDTILDLFCGLGNFTLALAKFAKKVVGVEGSNEMVKRGYFNASNNNLTNCEFYAADLINLNNIDKNPDLPKWYNNDYTKLLLDPPRAGAQEIIHLLHKQKNLKVAKLLYISCNPATLARDAGILVNQYNYKLAKIGILDMFPNTKHIESIALFIKDPYG